MYTAIIRLIHIWLRSMDLYKCHKKRLKTYENKIWRRIFGPVIDVKTDQWRKKFNQVLQEELKFVIISWFIKK